MTRAPAGACARPPSSGRSPGAACSGSPGSATGRPWRPPPRSWPSWPSAVLVQGCRMRSAYAAVQACTPASSARMPVRLRRPSTTPTGTPASRPRSSCGRPGLIGAFAGAPLLGAGTRDRHLPLRLDAGCGPDALADRPPRARRARRRRRQRDLRGADHLVQAATAGRRHRAAPPRQHVPHHRGGGRRLGPRGVRRGRPGRPGRAPGRARPGRDPGPLDRTGVPRLDPARPLPDAPRARAAWSSRPAISRSTVVEPCGGSGWATPRSTRSCRPSASRPAAADRTSGSGRGAAPIDPVQYLLQHGYTQWTSYQPDSRYWAFQWSSSAG